MRFLFGVVLLMVSFQLVDAQYDNSEKLSILGGFTSTGSEFVFWSDNVYGGNLQLVYDLKKIHEGAIGVKASGSWASGFGGYFGGLNFRVGSRFFADLDVLFGYSHITNEKLLSSYSPKEHSGAAMVSTIGLGFRLAESPLFFRLAYGGHFPTGNRGLNTGFNLQLGYRFR